MKDKAHRIKAGDVYCLSIGRGGDLWGEVVVDGDNLKFKVWNPAPAEYRNKTLDIKIGGKLASAVDN